MSGQPDRRAMPQRGKLMPYLDPNSTKLLNLTVLQRMDPFVEEILLTAVHVAFYEFNTAATQWSRKDVEGSLFVVKRTSQPRFRFIVMNRRHADNLVEDLLGDFEFEVQTPYLLYRNAAQEVNGIWFYYEHECEEVGNLFTRIFNAYSRVPTKSKVAPVTSKYEELEGVPSMEVIDGLLEPSNTTTAIVRDAPDDHTFVNFFSSAMAIGGSSNTAVPGHPPPLPTSTHNDAFMPAVRVQTPPVPTYNHIMHFFDAPPQTDSSSMRSTNLINPSLFFGPQPSSASSPLLIPPTSATMPTAPPLQPSAGTLQRPYGAPLLQPFPPPSPPPSLNPDVTPNNEIVITRDKVREALFTLVQDNVFIDMVHQALRNVLH
ncbi:unnamed protein product [Cuscuta epithymum]|uniref:mRNA-decapping enzyme-like protein n=1 Tax=Cuscuta epithymum TaxID=186058 RepID=A0AAV0D8L5_9ASTE|nr:unnamed protein product [Cuscuta epithymum]